MRALSLLVVLLLLTGCPPDDPAVDDPDMDNDFDEMEEVEEREYTANIQGQEGYEDVSGSLTAHVMENETHFDASISGAEAGATHPWHVHEGTCDTGGPIVGSANAYPAFEVGDDGAASADATIGYVLQEGGDYHVNVHGAPGDLGTIVACGNLTTN